MQSQTTELQPETRVRLLHDDTRHFEGVDPPPLPRGSEGTVEDVTPSGYIAVAWDIGYHLPHMVDEVSKII